MSAGKRPSEAAFVRARGICDADYHYLSRNQKDEPYCSYCGVIATALEEYADAVTRALDEAREYGEECYWGSAEMVRPAPPPWLKDDNDE